MTKVDGPDGEDVFSDVFPVRRGVVQGDITSPLYFIIALEAILRDHDKHPSKGTEMTTTGTHIHTLGYADDAVLVDESPLVAELRVNAISKGSKEDADMHINVDKTECMHLQTQDKVHKSTATEAEAQCKFTCSHCGNKYVTKRGLHIHSGKCKRKDVHEVEKIVDDADQW